MTYCKPAFLILLGMETTFKPEKLLVYNMHITTKKFSEADIRTAQKAFFNK